MKMYFIAAYADEGPKSKSDFSIPDLDPHFMYMKHYENYMLLQLVLKNDPSLVNRFQATKEIAVCERKLEWWSNRYEFDIQNVFQPCIEMKKLWKLDNVEMPHIKTKNRSQKRRIK
jgi:hypothetical protein